MKNFLFLLLLLCLANLRAFSQDIIITNYAGATTYSRYEEFQPNITVQNTGIVPLNTYFSAAMYLSADAQWDASDKAIESVGFPSSLGAGQSTTATTYRGAIDVAPGTYYLIIKADHENRVTETDESNNILVIPNFTITPQNVDFTFTSFSTDKTSYPRSSLVKISYVLKNLGATNTGGLVTIRLALSTDNVFDANDYYFTDVSEILTGPDVITSSTYISPLALPSTAIGNYYILAKVDYDMWGQEKFAETNESNNVVAKPITITASSGVDFVITNAGVPSDVGSWGWTVNLDVSNIGTTSAGGYKIGAQLITQGSTPNDYGYFETPYVNDNNLAAGENKSHWGLQFIAGVPAGTYYAAYKINFDWYVGETEYSNNVFIDYAHPIVIPPPPVYAVTFNSLTMSGVVDDTDQQLNLNFNLTNAGNTTGFNQKYTVVVKNASNATVHTQQATVLINFNPGQTVSKTITLNLASPLPIGTYQVSATCLSPVYTSPSPTSGTITITPTLYALTGTVKGEDGTPLTKGNLFLYQDDGNGVRFIQKITPYTGPTFSFAIDNHPHTLYFVPDPVVHPDYVPTIYGKTMMLQPENFFTTSANLSRDVEVLKISQLPAGPGVISGQVSSGGGTPAGRMRQSQVQTSAVPMSGAPVVLMSTAHQPVQITYTDATGFYEFKNLPREAYEILICFELDSRSMSPFSVDITDKNMSVNFDVNPEGVTPTTTQLYLSQTLTLSDFSVYQYGDTPIELHAQSSADLPIEYLSSDERIAAIVNNEIQIKGVGTVVISARNAGNNFYLPASVDRSLTINKADQSITMNSIPSLTYGDAAVVLESISSAALNVSYSSSDPTIASIEGDLLTIHSAGSVEIIAEQSGNEFYNASLPVHQQLTIEKATQTISFSALADVSTDMASFELSALASSGLQISFESSDNQIISIDGNMATIHAEGVVSVTAHQSGNQNYHPAEGVTRELHVNLVLGSETDIERQIYPNPTSNVVFLNIPNLRKVEVADVTGRVYGNYAFDESKIDLSELESGVYFIRLTHGNQSNVVKVVKR